MLTYKVADIHNIVKYATYNNAKIIQTQWSLKKNNHMCPLTHFFFMILLNVSVEGA